MGIEDQTNVVTSDANHELKIIIVGAGIGGLSAAINLRKQGHSVIVWFSFIDPIYVQTLTFLDIDIRV
jgi:thioredoxin reductase